MAAMQATKARAAALAIATIAAAASLALPEAAVAQQKGAVAGKGEQFFPVMVYRTGAYGPNGTPWANGYVDYLKLVNAQGGINGVKITFEECETAYDTARTVECYERLKSRPNAAVFQPLSTGGTFAITDKAPTDKIPLITAGYGRSESVEGEVFPWNFPLLGTYWTAADVLVQHLGKLNGGLDKLKGKKIALIYHDSPYGKEPIPLLHRAGQAARLPADHASGHASRRGAESGVAADPPVASRLRGPVGLGRDELHRHSRSGRDRLPARQDVRRMVVGRGA